FWDRRGLGTIRLFDARGLESVCGAARLGPDGLLVTGEELAARLGRSRRAIKVALLDQRAVAGVGNIYAAEILHRVGIDPRTACRSIPVTGWQAIADATRLVLAEAVRFAGSSIGDRTYRAVDGRPGRFQHRHRVYGREGRACATCGGSVTRIVQAQRSTFFCPGCQPRGRRGPRRGGEPGRELLLGEWALDAPQQSVSAAGIGPAEHRRLAADQGGGCPAAAPGRARRRRGRSRILPVRRDRWPRGRAAAGGPVDAVRAPGGRFA
ncbi:hypothetical protein EBR04_02565, partial [bacterium]|nr:hypothetical protein [bacterium]